MRVHFSDFRLGGAVSSTSDQPEDDEEDSDKAPETPPDEPRPPRVQDPPAEPDQKGPYVV